MNVSNIVDFMTKKMIFRKETNIFQQDYFLPSNHCVVDKSFDLYNLK